MKRDFPSDAQLVNDCISYHFLTNHPKTQCLKAIIIALAHRSADWKFRLGPAGMPPAMGDPLQVS